MKLAAVLLAALALAAFSAPQLAADSGAPQQAVCIVNTSSQVTDAQVQNAIPAFQAAVDQDFYPVWNQRAVLEFVPSGQTPPPGCWVFTLMDNLDVAALGYHDAGAGDIPYAHIEATADWTITFTHELFETLADPRGDRFAGTRSSIFPSKVYVLEVCDPVEADALAYTRPGADGTAVQISDFVTERWYDGAGRGKLDFTGHLRRAHTLYAGGYAWVLVNGLWQELRA